MAGFLRALTLLVAVAIAIWLHSWISLLIVAGATLLAWLTRERKVT